jgi:hypothetical protein
MPERIETVIIGGGQAGLAMSYHLSELGREHIILERGRIAERWRTERWDSLASQFPNWMLRLPGYAYAGDDPDGFMAPRRCGALHRPRSPRFPDAVSRFHWQRTSSPRTAIRIPTSCLRAASLWSAPERPVIRLPTISCKAAGRMPVRWPSPAGSSPLSRQGFRMVAGQDGIGRADCGERPRGRTPPF